MTRKSFLEAWAYIMIIVVCFTILLTLIVCSVFLFVKKRRRRRMRRQDWQQHHHPNKHNFYSTSNNKEELEHDKLLVDQTVNKPGRAPRHDDIDERLLAVRSHENRNQKTIKSTNKTGRDTSIDCLSSNGKKKISTSVVAKNRNITQIMKRNGDGNIGDDLTNYNLIYHNQQFATQFPAQNLGKKFSIKIDENQRNRLSERAVMNLDHEESDTSSNFVFKYFYDKFKLDMWLRRADPDVAMSELRGMDRPKQKSLDIQEGFLGNSD